MDDPLLMQLTSCPIFYRFSFFFNFQDVLFGFLKSLFWPPTSPLGSSLPLTSWSTLPSPCEPGASRRLALLQTWTGSARYSCISFLNPITIHITYFEGTSAACLKWSPGGEIGLLARDKKCWRLMSMFIISACLDEKDFLHFLTSFFLLLLA